MPRVQWPLTQGRPTVHILVTLAIFLNRFHYGNFGDPTVFGLEA
jgi:hypothetical protein